MPVCSKCGLPASYRCTTCHSYFCTIHAGFGNCPDCGANIRK